MNGVLVVAAHALRESLRRRVFLVVLVLSLLFLALYAWGASELFDDVEGFETQADTFGVDSETLAGATILGLGMFAIFFLGSVLATFITLGRCAATPSAGCSSRSSSVPLGRLSYLAGRLLAAAVVSAAYVVALFAACVVITGLLGWWPDRFVTPGLGLAAAVTVVAAVSLLGSALLSATANGIAVFMALGAGLTAGLLGQLGEGLDSDTLDRCRHRLLGAPLRGALPERPRPAHRGRRGADPRDRRPRAVRRGAGGGLLLWPYAALYVAVVFGLAALSFARRDL